MNYFIYWPLLLVLFLSQLYAQSLKEMSLEEWLPRQFEISKIKLLKNINVKDSQLGTVIASPSINPDYRYHWIRDSALVMKTFLSLKKYSYIEQFAKLTQYHQNISSYCLGGMGEVKFFKDGNCFQGPWGRPQNDGPALRAQVFIKYATILLAQYPQKLEYLKSVLYDSKFPTQSIIKKDLEYISHNWREPDFDLWEEIKGYHFFTRLAQRKALIEGAKLAYILNDPAAGDWYNLQADLITKEIFQHWDSQKNYLRSTIKRVDGIDYKTSGIDSSVLLAYIYNYDNNDPFYQKIAPQIMATTVQLVNIFESLYPINQKDNEKRGVAIGRYPEDRYSGLDTNGKGNPWYLIIHGFAEFCYLLALESEKKGVIIVNDTNHAFWEWVIGRKISSDTQWQKGQKEFSMVIDRLVFRGNQFLKRSQSHIEEDGGMPEQIHMITGSPTSAEDLSWSYSSFIDVYILIAIEFSSVKNSIYQ